MQLPSSFRPFRKSTIIVATDHVQAKLFLANDRLVEPLQAISVKADRMMDRDRSAVKRGGVVVAAQHEDEPQEWSREELYTKLSAELMRRLQNKEFETLAFTVPEEHENELKETLHIDLLKRARVFVPKLLTNEEPLDLVAHIQEAEEG